MYYVFISYQLFLYWEFQYFLDSPYLFKHVHDTLVSEHKLYIQSGHC